MIIFDAEVRKNFVNALYDAIKTNILSRRKIDDLRIQFSFNKVNFTLVPNEYNEYWLYINHFGNILFCNRVNINGNLVCIMPNNKGIFESNNLFINHVVTKLKYDINIKHYYLFSKGLNKWLHFYQNSDVTTLIENLKQRLFKKRHFDHLELFTIKYRRIDIIAYRDYNLVYANKHLLILRKAIKCDNIMHLAISI